MSRPPLRAAWWARREGRLTALRFLTALLVTFLFLFPVYWLFAVSVKAPEEIFASPPVWIPRGIEWRNYWVLFRDGDARTVLNSLIIAGTSTLLAMTLGTLAGYSLARHRTGGDNLAIWIVSQRMIPPIAIVFPIFLFFALLGWIDTFRGLILLYTAFNLPYVIWMMRGYFEDVPVELEESALIDGCTRFQVFTRVVIPLSIPALLATGLFAFMLSYAEFLFALTLSGEAANRPLSVVMAALARNVDVSWGLLNASIFLAVLPTLVLVILVWRYVVEGILVGGVKG